MASVSRAMCRSALIATLVILVPHAARADNAPHSDPDAGLARAYFHGLKHFDPATVKRTGKPPGNILWIVVDATRPDHLGCYGYDKPTTPFIDSLAKDSIQFLNAYTNAPWTRPSTATMLTGLTPSGHRTYTDHSRLPDDVRTVAQDLKALGYRTAAVVANGNASSIAGLNRGFDHYVDTASAWDGLPAAADVYASAEDWLSKSHKQKEPWFLFVFLIDPHDPYHAPPQYEKQFLGDFTGEPRRKAHWEYHNHYPEAERDSMIALYDAAIRYMDDQTRDFFGKLDKMKQLDDTTVIFTADHGEGFGEHGYYLHAYHHYDEITRVPLLVKSPALKGKGKVFHLVQLADLLPTLVTLAGGTPRAHLNGQPITDLLAKPVDRSRTIFSEYNEFGIRRSAAITLRNRIILQLPADAKKFDLRVPDRKLLPSVSFDREVVHVYDREADPFDRRPIELKSAPPEAQALYHTLKKRMLAEPPPNIGVTNIPKSVMDDLESLGYME